MGEPISWVAGQIERLQPEKPNNFNPRPAGVIRPGSGTDMLLRLLRQNPGRWYFHAELVLALGRSKGEVDWAVQLLRLQGMLEAKETEVLGKKPILRYRLSANGIENRLLAVGYRSLQNRR